MKRPSLIFIALLLLPVLALADYPCTGKPTKSIVNIREKASSSGNIVGEAKKSITYNVLGEITSSNGDIWYKIEYKHGKTGYILSDFFAIDKNESSIKALKESVSQSSKTDKEITSRLEGVHVIDFLERYYTRLLISRNLIDEDIEPKGMAWTNDYANRDLFHVDELLLSKDENDIITSLSFEITLPPSKQISALSSLYSNTNNDLVCVSLGFVNDDFFSEHASNAYNHILDATVDSYYEIGDYLAFLQDRTMHFYLKSQYKLQ